MLNFHSADGMPFLGKKVNQSGLFRKNFHGDLQMDLKRRQEGELGSSSDPQDRTAPERGLAYHQEISGGTGTRACPAAGSSKLDPFKAAIADWLEKDPTGTAAIVEQRLRPLRYNGGHSVLRAYVYTVRPQLKPSRASLRMEPPPGERFAVDSGHVGLLDYASDKRKPYAFALWKRTAACCTWSSTHSQSFETFVRCHVHAFTPLGGVAREIAYDNLATAAWSVPSRAFSQAEVVRRVFSMSKDGAGYGEIGRQLNRDCVPGPRREHWSHYSIFEMLRKLALPWRSCLGPDQEGQEPRDGKESHQACAHVRATARRRPRMANRARGIVAGRPGSAGTRERFRCPPVWGGIQRTERSWRSLFSGILTCAKCGSSMVICAGDLGAREN
jgi:hypothetical protein